MDLVAHGVSRSDGTMIDKDKYEKYVSRQNVHMVSCLKRIGSQIDCCELSFHTDDSSYCYNEGNWQTRLPKGIVAAG